MQFFATKFHTFMPHRRVKESEMELVKEQKEDNKRHLPHHTVFLNCLRFAVSTKMVHTL